MVTTYYNTMLCGEYISLFHGLKHQNNTACEHMYLFSFHKHLAMVCGNHFISICPLILLVSCCHQQHPPHVGDGDTDYILGGEDTCEILCYDPVKNQWTRVGSLPTFMYECHCIVQSDQLYVLGGHATNESIEIVDFVLVCTLYH